MKLATARRKFKNQWMVSRFNKERLLLKEMLQALQKQGNQSQTFSYP